MSGLDEEETKYLRETIAPVVGFYAVGLVVVVAFLLFFLIRCNVTIHSALSLQPVSSLHRKHQGL